MFPPGPLVDADWLLANRGQGEVADVRWSMADGPKFAAFGNGHLSGAIFVDLDADLSDRPGAGGRHPLPAVARFRRRVAERGLGRLPTICYDDSSGATAARLWWMLDAIGHSAAVLDGGLAAWPNPLERGETVADLVPPIDPRRIGDPGVSDWPSGRVVGVDDVLDHVDGGSTLLDARSAERFRGQPNPVDPVVGHIPGGRSRPWTENIGADGRFRPASDLWHDFEELGINGSGEWLASCGSGVTACHNLLAARIAGLPDGRLYAGSWSEWVGDLSRPVELGPDPPAHTAR